MHCSCKSSQIIKAGARSSNLSRVQAQEVLTALQQHHPHIQFDMIWMATVGDRDQKTSLRTLNKTDFFTKEIDEAILKGECRIGIHSAKDLPDPIPPTLKRICLTKGLTSVDALVMKNGETLDSLPTGAIIATSSERREEAARELRSDLRFIDLRGTIEQRLMKLNAGEAHGVIVAEAALIRLNLTHLNRIFLPGGNCAWSRTTRCNR